MGLTQNNAGATGLNTVAEWAGYLGVAPFVLCLAGVGLLPDSGARELLQRIALAWGAVLLAFSGAVHWGLAIAGRLPWDAARTGGALAPAVLGAVARGCRPRISTCGVISRSPSAYCSRSPCLPPTPPGCADIT